MVGLWSIGTNVSGAGAGQTGVQLFFMLSGFLMMRLYGETPCTLAATHRFMVARAARILPLYWAVILLSAAAAGAGMAPHYSVVEAFWPALLFGTAPQELWSVPVEVQFYALFLLVWRHIGAAPGPLLALAAASLLLAAGWRGLVSDAAILIPYLPVFLLGGWLGKVADRLPRAAGHPLAAMLCLVAVVLNFPGLRPAWSAEIWAGFYPSLWLDPARMLTALALLASAAAARGSWLGGPVLHWVGRISFGVYLFHRLVLRWAADFAAPGPALAALCLALTLLLAALSLALIEQPAGRALRRALAPRPKAPQSEAG